MSIKATIFVWILALAGVGAMIYTGWNDVGARLAPRTEHTLLNDAQLPVDAIDRITLARHGEAPMTFQRTEARWMQTEPFAYPMDPFSIRQLAVQARQLDVSDTVDPAALADAGTLAAIGLDPPAAEITYGWGDESLTLHLGRRTVAGRAYLRVAGSDAVHVVGYRLHERAAEMDPREWRDRTIFQNVGAESSRIQIEQSGAPSTVLERDRRQWLLREPVQTRVDALARDAFLQDLGRAVLAGFILDQPTAEELARFGLAEPVAQLTVTTPRGPSGETDVQRLAIGHRASAGTEDRFGIVAGRPVVVRVPAAALRSLFRQPQSFAEPTGSGTQPADIKTMVIRTKDAAEFRLERELDRWRAPDHGNVEVNAASVQELLTQLTQMRATSVDFKPYPHELEVATVTFHGFDGRAIDTVRIAKEKDTGRWAFENGDNVLRVYPPGLTLRLTPEEFGL